MGTTLVSEIINDVRADLQDDDIEDFTDATLLKYANRAQRDIVILKPETSPVAATIQLAEGTRQSIPSGSIQFVRLLRNMGTDGATVGNAIRNGGDIELFSQLYPDWHTHTTSATVQLFFYDPRNPRVFYNYPPQPSLNRGYVDEEDFGIPTAMATTASAISLDDIYAECYKDAIKMYAYQLDKYLRAYPDKWMMFRDSLHARLGIKDQKEAETEP
jgi:hypothetical protein